MTAAHRRMSRYYLTYARQHKDDWQALDGAQFEQIRRGWRVASEGCVGLTPDEQVGLIFGYLNALDSFLERRGLWTEWLAWNRRRLTAAQAIGKEALAEDLLNDLGLCYWDLGQYAVSRDHACSLRRRSCWQRPKSLVQSSRHLESDVQDASLCDILRAIAL